MLRPSTKISNNNSKEHDNYSLMSESEEMFVNTGVETFERNERRFEPDGLNLLEEMMKGSTS